jgi:hypothetical protein
MFPPHSETPSLLALQEKFKRLQNDFDNCKGLSRDDYALIGEWLVTYGYIDLNLHRLAEAMEVANILPAQWQGKMKKANLTDKANAVRETPIWNASALRALEAIEGHRQQRHLCAHCAVRRFPEDDAFLFIFHSVKDFKRVFGHEPDPGIAMHAIGEVADMRRALKEVTHLQGWFAKTTADLTAKFLPVHLQANVAV